MFNTKKDDKTAEFQNTITLLIESFKEKMASYDDTFHQAIVAKIDEGLKEISGKNGSILSISLKVKWLIKEIGALKHDGQVRLTTEESELYRSIEDTNAKYSDNGQGIFFKI
ncbi:hypothetical protein [Streptococcus zalophi]|uniref:hypothetical protein n=1 Tax=Streptococcus zalophi TaxID=640031 RepID=UPI00215CB12A|nr:hypothetical protein [Streptococcus zalophi]MCR8967926.1 hypothetical protein [Streptococcus zalophi]